MAGTVSNVKTCSTCGETGWVVLRRKGLESVQRCPDCQTGRKRKTLLEKAQIPPRYDDRGFDVYSIHDPSQEVALKKSIDFVELFPRVERGILLVGPCGVGKTHLAVAILTAIVEEKLAPVRFVDEAELLRHLHYSYGPDSTATEREVLMPLMEVDLLVWDDLGTGRPTDWARETIRMVLNNRYTYQKPTIMTTNWPLRATAASFDGSKQVGQQLDERIGTRLFSRIMEMCEVVEIKGPDARTEIHKARMDFKQSTTGKTPGVAPLSEPRIRVPSSLIECTKCGSKRVQTIDQSAVKKSKSGKCLELFCQCESCKQHFLARFFPATARVDYPVER